VDVTSSYNTIDLPNISKTSGNVEGPRKVQPRFPTGKGGTKHNMVMAVHFGELCTQQADDFLTLLDSDKCTCMHKLSLHTFILSNLLKLTNKRPFQ